MTPVVILNGSASGGDRAPDSILDRSSPRFNGDERWGLAIFSECPARFSLRAMDKKSKKQLEVLRQRQQNLQRQLAGARRQADDPAEVKELEAEMQKVTQEIERLQKGG